MEYKGPTRKCKIIQSNKVAYFCGFKRKNSKIFLQTYIWAQMLLLSTCGVGKFQIPPSLQRARWSPSCGLNLCHHTNYIFTPPMWDLSSPSLWLLWAFFSLQCNHKKSIPLFHNRLMGLCIYVIHVFWGNSKFLKSSILKHKLGKFSDTSKEFKYWRKTRKHCVICDSLAHVQLEWCE